MRFVETLIQNYDGIRVRRGSISFRYQAETFQFISVVGESIQYGGPGDKEGYSSTLSRRNGLKITDVKIRRKIVGNAILFQLG